MSNFIGIGVHRDECHATVQDKEGETVKQGYFQNSPSGFEGSLKTILLFPADTYKPIGVTK